MSVAQAKRSLQKAFGGYGADIEFHDAVNGIGNYDAFAQIIDGTEIEITIFKPGDSRSLLTDHEMYKIKFNWDGFPFHKPNLHHSTLSRDNEDEITILKEKNQAWNSSDVFKIDELMDVWNVGMAHRLRGDESYFKKIVQTLLPIMITMRPEHQTLSELSKHVNINGSSSSMMDPQKSHLARHVLSFLGGKTKKRHRKKRRRKRKKRTRRRRKMKGGKEYTVYTLFTFLNDNKDTIEHLPNIDKSVKESIDPVINILEGFKKEAASKEGKYTIMSTRDLDIKKPINENVVKGIVDRGWDDGPSNTHELLSMRAAKAKYKKLETFLRYLPEIELQLGSKSQEKSEQAGGKKKSKRHRRRRRRRKKTKKRSKRRHKK